MQTNRHQQAALIDKLLAASITPQEERNLREHLRECSACQQQMDASQRAIAGLGGFSFEVNPNLNAQVQDAITRRVRELEMQRSKHRSLKTFAVALALTIVGSLAAWSFTGPLAGSLNITTNQLHLGLLFFWVAPSLLFSLLILVAPRLTNGQFNREGRTI
jgi:anti-sigma factor RsiW